MSVNGNILATRIRHAQRTLDAFEQRHACVVDIASSDYLNHWLRSPDMRLPVPDLRHYWREPGLWIPMQLAWTPVAAGAQSLGTNGGTTSFAFDSTSSGGADLLFVAVHGFGFITSSDLSDNIGSTFTPLHMQTDNGSTNLRTWYAWGSNVHTNSVHHFIFAGASSFSALAARAYKGSRTSSDPFDTEATGGFTTSSTTVSPGGLTRASGNLLLASVGFGDGSGTVGTLTIDSTFDTPPTWQDFVGGTSYGVGISGKVSTGALENPLWTMGAAGQNAANMSAFVAGGAVTPLSPPPYSATRNRFITRRRRIN